MKFGTNKNERTLIWCLETMLKNYMHHLSVWLWYNQNITIKLHIWRRNFLKLDLFVILRSAHIIKSCSMWAHESILGRLCKSGFFVVFRAVSQHIISWASYNHDLLYTNHFNCPLSTSVLPTGYFFIFWNTMTHTHTHTYIHIRQ
jgi:hypothetical protein